MTSPALSAPPPALSPISVGAASAGVGLPRHLTLLTILRFFAALWVFVFHFQGAVGQLFPSPWVHSVANGAYAMTFFFILSGTVLAYGCFDLPATSQAARQFYRGRLARIYPTYALLHLIALAWFEVPFSDPARWAYVNMLSALGVQAWFPSAFIGINAATWSLSCEFFFYLLFPALLPLLRSLTRPEQLLRGVVYLSLFAGFLGLSDIAFKREGTFPLVYISPLIRLPEFIIGMLIGIALRQRKPGQPASMWPVVFASALLLVASFNTAYQAGLWTRANLIIVPVIAGLIFATGRYEIGSPESLTNGLWRMLKYFGHISYAYFLCHLPILVLLRFVLKREDALASAIRNSPLTWLLIGGVVTLLLSVAVYEWIEKPMRRWMLSTRKPSGNAPTALTVPTST